MKTKNGIELNLSESNYTFNYGILTFYFSSEFYKNKFANEVENFVNLENAKIYNKYKIKCECNVYLAISLYKKIEKRGFLVEFGIENLPKEIEFKMMI